MNKSIHIISFDVPYPVSHGGYFDLFYKLKALKEEGFSIQLHCFEYGRGEQPELEKYCSSVHYYPRKKLSGISFTLPYIVSTRISEELENRLSQDEYPILLEGTHTSYILFARMFPGRKILLRLHNIEQVYYRYLYKAEKKIFKKLYFRQETRSLEKYEALVGMKASVVLTVSEKDRQRFSTLVPAAHVSYLPLFIPYEKLSSHEGKGSYVLYHGNLAIAENEKSALYITSALRKSGVPLVIAGRRPSERLLKKLSKYEHVKLYADPGDEELDRLIREAHVNIVHSFNDTGIKIKLIHALFQGRHCIVNEAALPGESFRPFVHQADNSTALRKKLTELMELPFSIAEAQEREAFLQMHFNNKANAAQISAFLQ